MDWDELQYKVNELAEEAISQAIDLSPTQLGFDRRSASRFYLLPDQWIAHSMSDRRTAEYYGGLEYVPAEYVQQVGDFVFYSVENERIAGHVENYQP